MGEDRDREAALRDCARRPQTDGAGGPVGELEVSGRRMDTQLRVVTTTPNELCARLHNRMPVVLKPEAWPLWLGEEPADTSALKALLAPFPSDGMICWPVNARVGNVKNNDASLIELINAVSH